MRDVSPVSSPSSGPSRCVTPDFEPFISKREYLLAQIRQKDTIIESLLKQVCAEHRVDLPCTEILL